VRGSCELGAVCAVWCYPASGVCGPQVQKVFTADSRHAAAEGGARIRRPKC
jgi:hypothetical protein